MTLLLKLYYDREKFIKVLNHRSNEKEFFLIKTSDLWANDIESIAKRNDSVIGNNLCQTQ